ncbi:hypothetical protein MW887_008067 [Aspergillus wentii]|nr:hypothetical protein MW887_008067 [Aspergillus wentii]
MEDERDTPSIPDTASTELRQLERAKDALFSLAKRQRLNEDQRLFQYEIDLLDESYDMIARHAGSERFLLTCVRKAVEAESHDVIERLFAKGITTDLMKDEFDIFRLVIAGTRYCHSTLGTVVELLIAHGADVNASDEYGNAALFYACACGFYDIFRSLIDAGADIFIVQDQLDLKQINNIGETTNRPVDDLAHNGDLADKDNFTADDIRDNNNVTGDDNLAVEINLLEVTLQCRHQSEVAASAALQDLWPVMLDTRWGLIISSLLDAGLRSDPGNPYLVKLVHVACFEGNIEWIQKLVHLGVDLYARPPASGKHPHSFGSALHAAIGGGYPDIVAYLIEHGADVHTPCLNRIDDTEMYLSPTALACQQPSNPPGETSLFAAKWSMDLQNHKSFEEISVILLDAGLGREDRQLLLYECATRGHPELVKRLLEQGNRMENVPISDNLGVVQLLHDAGSKIDMAKMQAHAARQGCLDLLEYLVMRGGPCIPIGEFASITEDIVTANHLSILRFLVTGYGFNVNKPFRKYHEPRRLIRRTNLLQQALRRENVAAVRLLIMEGADVRCPGLWHTGLAYFRKHVNAPAAPSKSRSLDPVAINHRQIIETLLSYDKISFRPTRGYLPRGSDSTPLHEYAQRLRETLELKSVTSQDPPTINTANEYAYPQPYEVPYTSHLPPFEYSPLSGFNSIRAIELEPSTVSESPIHCRLVELNLLQRPYYEALSYVWGNSPKRVSILVNGCLFYVTPNLWSALFRLRRRKRGRLLWADAICINQNDWEERGQQVRIMRDIYKTAFRVVVWLGEHAENSQYIVKNRERHIEEDDWNTETPNNNVVLSSRAHWEAFRKLTERPWFFRTWIIQEVCLAKDRLVVCGPDSTRFWQLWDGISPDRFHAADGVHGPSQFSSLISLTSFTGLKKAIAHSRICQATDPKDKVYGILGLFESQLIPVDYNVSISEVYRRFTQAVIERTDSLHLLHNLGIHRKIEGLPSWVPDYTSKPLHEIVGDLEGPSMTSMPPPQFHASDLILKGKHLDMVQAVGDELMADSNIKPGTAEFATILGRWESLAIQIRRKRFDRTISEAFGGTLIAHTPEMLRKEIGYEEQLSYYAMHFVAWYHVYGTGILRQADLDYFKTVKTALSWSSKKYTPDDMERDVGCPRHLFRDDDDSNLEDFILR